MITIRQEIDGDQDAVGRVTIDAFANCELGHQGEAELIKSLRMNCAECLSLVAVCHAEVIGHILFSPATIETHYGTLKGMGLGPLSVAPSQQRCGVGSLLVRSGLEFLKQRDCPFVIVLGHPEYYSRFGFEPAERLQLFHGFDGISQSVFFVLKLPNSHTVDLAGKAIYRPEFGPQHT